MRRRSLLLLDTAVPVIVGAVVVVASVLHTGGNTGPVAILIGLAAAAVLGLRRTSPGWSLATSMALVQVLFYIDAAIAPVAVLFPAVALYSLAQNRDRAQQILAAAVAVLAVVGADILHRGNIGIVASLGHVALVAVPLLAAEVLRTRRSHVSLLLERLDLVERTREQEAERRVEHERLRIAGDLHDVVAHTLSTINVQAATAAHLLDRNPNHARAALECIEDASRDAINELRAILGVLRDPDQPDTPRTPAPTVDEVAGLVERARGAGLDIRLDVTGKRPNQLPDAISLAGYRIVQESLTNARRHAAGATVRVSVSFQPDELVLTIENDAATTGHENGHTGTPGVGITGMTERARSVGGTLNASPLPAGYRIDATLPYAPPPR